MHIHYHNTIAGPVRAPARQAVPGDTAFAHALADRVKVPATRVDEFLGWSRERLNRETESVVRVLERFARAVAESESKAESADAFLRELDLKLIAEDHNWRAIFASIRKQHLWGPEHKREAIVHYAQYLTFRRDLLEYIIVRRTSLEETGAWPTPNGGRGSPAATIHPAAGFVALPHGEAVALNLPASRFMDIQLAAYRFTLVGGQPAQMIDEQGRTYDFRPGRNLVGRHPAADIALPADFRIVSRTHLTLEWVRGTRVIITDLSSGGTYVPETAVAESLPVGESLPAGEAQPA